MQHAHAMLSKVLPLEQCYPRFYPLCTATQGTAPPTGDLGQQQQVAAHCVLQLLVVDLKLTGGGGGDMGSLIQGGEGIWASLIQGERMCDCTSHNNHKELQEQGITTTRNYNNYTSCSMCTMAPPHTHPLPPYRIKPVINLSISRATPCPNCPFTSLATMVSKL